MVTPDPIADAIRLVRAHVASGAEARAGFARRAGVDPGVLREVMSPGWSCTTRTLSRLLAAVPRRVALPEDIGLVRTPDGRLLNGWAKFDRAA